MLHFFISLVEEFAVCPANITYATSESACLDLSMLAEVDVDGDNVEDVAGSLARITDTIENITSSEVVLVAETLENIVNVQNGSQVVTNSVVNVVNNILELSEGTRLSEETFENNTSSSIITSLETQASLSLEENDEVLAVESNVALSGLSINRTSEISGIGFGILTNPRDDFDNNSTRTYTDRETILSDAPTAYIYVPKTPSSENYTNNLKFIFIAYRNDFLFPSSVLATENLVVDGVIVSASIDGDHNVAIDSGNPVVFENKGNHDASTGSKSADSCYKSEVKDPSCMFWDFTLENGAGEWSEDGCRYVGMRDGRTVCHCDHLTNFAVLVFHGKQLILSKALDIVSTVGCVLSIASLIITAVIFLAFKQLRKRARMILVHLCISLTMLYTVFVVGIERTCPRLFCSIIAILLHYFTLTTLSWMAVEARYLYIKLVRIYDPESENFVLKYAVAAWGLPLIIVGVSAGMSFHSYQNELYCFVTPGPIVYYALLLPIGLVLLSNIGTFVAIMARITRQRPGQSRRNSSQQSIQRFQTSIGVSILLGLTWVFGFLAINEATFIFQILFCVFNSLQGVFIFIFFCLRQKDVRGTITSCFVGTRRDGTSSRKPSDTKSTATGTAVGHTNTNDTFEVDQALTEAEAPQANDTHELQRAVTIKEHLELKQAVVVTQ